MVQNYFVKLFLFLLCSFGNTAQWKYLEVLHVGEGVMSKSYRFKIFSGSFLDSTSIKSDTMDLLDVVRLFHNMHTRY